MTSDEKLRFRIWLSLRWRPGWLKTDVWTCSWWIFSWTYLSMSGDVDDDDDGLYISCMMMVWISAVLLLQLSLVQHQLNRQSQAGLASARFNFSFKLSHHTNTHYNWQSLLHFDYLHCKIWNNIDNIKYKSNPYFLNFSFSSLHIYHTLSQITLTSWWCVNIIVPFINGKYSLDCKCHVFSFRSPGNSWKSFK